MNIKEYISGGAVESYVLGLSTPDERAEFEKLCAEYPELVAARNEFEIALEQQLLQDTKIPAGDVKEKVMQAIRQQTSENNTKIISMNSAPTNTRRIAPMRWVAAASVVLLLASAYFAFNFYTKNQELQSQLAQTKEQQTALDERVAAMEKEQQIMSDPNVAVVSMKGTEKAPTSSANIYWDSTSANVYLVVKNMPKLPSDKQYQLWALIDGKPKDLGLFDVGDNKKLFLKMKDVQKADAFAITIETRGNQGGPTLEQLQTMGKASL